jgi:hypothetical protein
MLVELDSEYSNTVLTVSLFVRVFCFFSSLKSLRVYKLKGLWSKALGTENGEGDLATFA